MRRSQGPGSEAPSAIKPLHEHGGKRSDYPLLSRRRRLMGDGCKIELSETAYTKLNRKPLARDYP